MRRSGGQRCGYWVWRMGEEMWRSGGWVNRHAEVGWSEMWRMRRQRCGGCDVK